MSFEVLLFVQKLYSKERGSFLISTRNNTLNRVTWVPAEVIDFKGRQQNFDSIENSKVPYIYTYYDCAQLPKFNSVLLQHV